MRLKFGFPSPLAGEAQHAPSPLGGEGRVRGMQVNFDTFSRGGMGHDENRKVISLPKV